jgi:PAS domain S-box-containing protein
MSSTVQFRSVFDHLREGCQIIAPDWRYLYVNEAAARQGRHAKESLIGRTMMEVYPGIEKTSLFAILSRCMDSRRPAKATNEFRHPDGALGWFELSIQPVEEGLFVMSIDVTAQRRAEERTRTQLRRLNALRAIDLAILSTTDGTQALKTVVEETRAQLHVDAAAILLLNRHTHRLELAAATGLHEPAPPGYSLPLGVSISAQAARERRTISAPDLAEVEPSDSQELFRTVDGTQSAYATPLVAKGQLLGVLVVEFRSTFRADYDWLGFFEAMAGQAAMAIDSGQLFGNLQRANHDLGLAYDTTIEGWSRAMDLRDHETEGHTLRVTETTVELGNRAGLSAEEMVHVRRGALLHDIGKMGVPDAILLKPGPLTDEEWVIMRQHPQIAFDLLKPIGYLRPALDIPYCHHEKWDGSGYPRRLKGVQIPRAARLFAVVDVWDALRSDRPYRPRWPDDKVHAFLRAQSGTHFDPDAVDLFLQIAQGL